MQGESGVIQGLNRLLRNELTAINQYYLHSRMYAQWGYAKLAARTREQAMGEMRHADRLLERILFLEEMPELGGAAAPRVGRTPLAVLEADAELEREALPVLREVLAQCEQQGDYVSRDLVGSILADEETHLDWLETQLGLIKAIGLENYLQSQV